MIEVGANIVKKNETAGWKVWTFNPDLRYSNLYPKPVLLTANRNEQNKAFYPEARRPVLYCFSGLTFSLLYFLRLDRRPKANLRKRYRTMNLNLLPNKSKRRGGG